MHERLKQSNTNNTTKSSLQQTTSHLREERGFLFKPAKPKPTTTKNKPTSPTPTPLNPRIQSLRPRTSHKPSSLRNEYPTFETPVRKQKRESGTGRRRSSFALRGKRISNATPGLCPLPHESIHPAEFYRHIDAEVSDPMRMRQLLVWCGKKSAANQKMASKSTVVTELVNKIQQEMIEALMHQRINTSWYHRPAGLTDPDTPVKKSRHPINTENLARAQDYKRHIERLESEQSQWNRVLDDQRARYANLDRESKVFEPVIEVHPPGLPNHVRKWIRDQYTHLQLELDTTTHILRLLTATQYRASRVANKVAGDVLQAYEEKEQRVVTKVDTMDVLRLLAVI